VKFELEKSQDPFVVMSFPTDEEKYRMKILNISMFVPVAQLSLPLYNQISTLQAKQDVSIHFRRLEVRSINLPRNSEEFNSTTLFSEEIPCRITFCFVETSKKIGTRSSNPFNFQRRWTIIKKRLRYFEGQSEREIRLEERLRLLERELSSFKSSVKGKGRGKNTTGASTSTAPSLRPTPRETNQTNPSSIDSDQWTDDASSTGVGEEMETIFIKKVELILNGAPGSILIIAFYLINKRDLVLIIFFTVDQLEDEQTSDECMAAFYRLYENNGQMNSLFSCGLSYDDFREVFLNAKECNLICQLVAFARLSFVNAILNMILYTHQIEIS